jgi:hypothetical protein
MSTPVLRGGAASLWRPLHRSDPSGYAFGLGGGLAGVHGGEGALVTLSVLSEPLFARPHRMLPYLTSPDIFAGEPGANDVSDMLSAMLCRAKPFGHS